MCNWLVGLIVDNLALGAVIGALWSFLVEMFPAFENLTPVQKRWCMFMLCMGLPILALLLAVYGLACPDVALNVEWIAKALATGAAAFAASQIAHIRLLKA